MYLYKYICFRINKLKTKIMNLTNDIIEQNKFKRINNSMWRLKNITLQNGYTDEGGNIYERILSTKKAYKVCVDGKYLQMIWSEDQLLRLIERISV